MDLLDTQMTYLSWIESRLYELQARELDKNAVEKIKQAYEILEKIK